MTVNDKTAHMNYSRTTVRLFGKGGRSPLEGQRSVSTDGLLTVTGQSARAAFGGRGALDDGVNATRVSRLFLLSMDSIFVDNAMLRAGLCRHEFSFWDWMWVRAVPPYCVAVPKGCHDCRALRRCVRACSTRGACACGMCCSPCAQSHVWPATVCPPCDAALAHDRS